MARLADEGHRVVLVTATAGEAGLSSADQPLDGSLGTVRRNELERSASALGCARLVVFGYPDSGEQGTVPGGFAGIDPVVPAKELAAVLHQEKADLLVTYDANGGYGHPDHLQVHRVGMLASELAGIRLQLHATVNRDLMRRALAVAKWTRRTPAQFRAEDIEGSYAPRSEITHRIDVRRYVDRKRAAMEAHCSQAVGGDTQRTLAWLLSLPGPLFRLALGREWFIEAGRNPGGRLLDDLLFSLR